MRNSHMLKIYPPLKLLDINKINISNTGVSASPSLFKL